MLTWDWTARAAAVVLTLTACNSLGGRDEAGARAQDTDWPIYGGDQAGTRYSPLNAINRENVDRLSVAWSIRIDELPPADGMARFENTPLVVGGRMYVFTPRNRLVALNAATGDRLWSFDAEIDSTQTFAEGFTVRGVALWTDPLASGDLPCRSRVFLATLDARLMAVDAETGALCPDFGHRGTVHLRGPVNDPAVGSLFSVTSPPAVVGDIVAVGSSIDKTIRVPAPAGTVQAFDARSGRAIWTYVPLGDSSGLGGGNVWSVMSVDERTGTLYLPTASPAPEHVGGNRPGPNEHANSVIALDGATGRFLWAWQTVRHDLWDYDVAAQPILADLTDGGNDLPVVIIGSKTGMIFVLDRRSGTPVLPVEERLVPTSDVVGERPSLTQVFPVIPPPLIGTSLTPDSAFGINARDREFCRQGISSLRNEGIFTPPSLRGSLLWPGVWGGINWSGMAWDPHRQILVTTISRLAMAVQLHEPGRSADSPYNLGAQYLPLYGSRYAATRWPLVAPSGLPCSPPPWSAVIAIDLPAGSIRWSVPLGVVPSLRDMPESHQWGSLAFGGAIVTAGGLVIVAASQDDMIRAFDIDTGALLWEHTLPAGGQATPLTYSLAGEQYVTIVAGGRAGIGTPGDWVVTFALPD